MNIPPIRREGGGGGLIKEECETNNAIGPERRNKFVFEKEGLLQKKTRAGFLLQERRGIRKLTKKGNNGRFTNNGKGKGGEKGVLFTQERKGGTVVPLGREEGNPADAGRKKKKKGPNQTKVSAMRKKKGKRGEPGRRKKGELMEGRRLYRGRGGRDSESRV